MLRKWMAVFVAMVAMMGVAGAASAETVLKIGTLAPQDSPWGKEFKTWRDHVDKDTNGELKLDFIWNGQGGDEVLMIQKMRSGQLDGAAVTAVGLSQTGVTDVLAFQLPGLFSNWGKLDAARNAMKDEFSRQFEGKGFTILGWGDVGAAKLMSVGFEVHHPKDLQGKGNYFLAGDPIGPRIFAAIGGITPRQVTVPEILPGLTNGSISVLIAPPLAAEQLQWASRVTHINTITTGFGIGAIVMSSSRLQSLPESLRAVMIKRGAESAESLTHSIRNRDAQSFARLKGSKTAYDLTEGEKKEWQDLFALVRQQLRGSVITPGVFDRVTQLAQ